MGNLWTNIHGKLFGFISKHARNSSDVNTNKYGNIVDYKSHVSAEDEN